jgi:multidrug efflux pump subunit AcrA (membrane-fusion protein)
MKLKSLIIGVVMILCAGLAIFALTKWHRDSGGDDDEGGAHDENAEAVVTVQTNTLQRMTLHHYVNGYGTIEPAPATADQPAAGGPLSSPIAGVVAKVNVVAGQQVKEGDVLVELNSGTASYTYAKAEVERQKKLFAEQNTSLKNLQDVEAQLASLQIVAPVSGTVTRLSAKAGMAVDANAMVAEVIDLNHLAVRAQIPAANAREVRLGQEMQIGESNTTSVSFISPAVETTDGTVLALGMVLRNDGLRPGEFLPVKIITDTRTNCLAAPAESVVTDEDGKSFIVLVKGEEAAQVPVKTGLRENGWVEIEGADLQEGAGVVTVGAYGFPDKAKIRLAGAGAEEESTTTNSVSAKNAAPATNSRPEK